MLVSSDERAVDHRLPLTRHLQYRVGRYALGFDDTLELEWKDSCTTT